VRAGLVLIALATGCAGRKADPSLTLTLAPEGLDTRVTLVAAPGLKVNARLKPALELDGGAVLRFDSPRVTTDSAYFAEPPTALLAGRHRGVRGTLRASVCGVDEQVCRTVIVRL
jgi:hypothetical protein